MESVLKISNLCKTYDTGVKVLNDINLAMPPGGFLILVGPSGCGKSTLLNCIAGLEATTSGSIHIAARDVTQIEPKDRDISMVFQSYALYPTMTVKDNIAFGMKVRGVPKQEQEPKINEVANLLQITHLLDRKPGQLSGGQRQRVAIGRALVRQPSLYLFDEPLSNLDAKLRVEMRSELKALHEKTQSSFVYVTHDQVEAMTMGTQIAVLNGGHIQQYGTPYEIYNHPANVFVASFMGSPSMNILSGRIRRRNEAVQVSIISKQGEEQFINLPHYTNQALVDGVWVNVGIRPEHCGLEMAGEQLTLPVLQVETTGTDQFIKLGCFNDQTMTARFTDVDPIQSGKNLTFNIKTSQIHLFDTQTELAIPRS